MIWASYIFLFLSGSAKGISNLLQFHFDKSVFSNVKRFEQEFWNPSRSWRNKWKHGDPEFGEKFWKSSTWLVWTTDAWHLSESIMIKCIIMSVFCQFFRTSPPEWYEFIMIFSFYLGFWITFESRIFRRK